MPTLSISHPVTTYRTEKLELTNEELAQFEQMDKVQKLQFLTLKNVAIDLDALMYNPMRVEYETCQISS